MGWFALTHGVLFRTNVQEGDETIVFPDEIVARRPLLAEHREILSNKAQEHSKEAYHE
jgi:hypothetical protein